MRRWVALASWCTAAAVLAGCTSVGGSGIPTPPPAGATALPSSGNGTPGQSGTELPPGATVFAVIGDYGVNNTNADNVASLVSSWDPAYILALGDNYYTRAGGKGTAKYDESTGKFYCDWLKDITTTGSHCPSGAANVNAFFPTLGNHDYNNAGLKTYLAYFDIPGSRFASSSDNERYYDFVQGDIHYFVLNSNEEEPDGITSTSKQARWLKQELAASTSRWNIVYDHHPPYSSDARHGSTPELQWPFAEWGADAVLSGHAHVYERILADGIVYLVNGLGGANRVKFETPVAGSAVRFDSDWGALRGIATDKDLTFEFIAVDGSRVDSYTIPARPGR